MTLDAFLDAAWNDHADRPREVADRLAASLSTIGASDGVAPYARIVTHVFGEHLGEWERGVRLLESLRALPVFDDGPAASGAVARGIATLRYAGGDTSAADALPSDDRIAAVAAAAAAFAGRREHGRAIEAYARALSLAGPDLAPASPAHRALAIGGNNLAIALEEKPDRDDAETRGMIAAAEAGVRHWTIAGTWLEEERAHYRLARSLLAAGRPRDATASARRCIDVCERNDAPAFERFFGHAALAIAHRASGDAAAFDVTRRDALRWHEQVPESDRPWCAADLETIGR